MNGRRRRKRKGRGVEVRMAVDTNVNARNDYPPESISYCGACVCMHRTQACMYVSTATGMFLNWRRKREEGEKNGDLLLVSGWRFCPARGHEGGGGSGVRGWKFEKNMKYIKKYEI